VSARISMLLMLVIATPGCNRVAPEEVETQGVVPVVVATAQIGTIRSVVTASGVVTPAPGADFTVTPPEAARIAEMPKAEGDRVRRGDLLVRFEIPSLTANLTSRHAAVESAQARVAAATASQLRARDLFERGIGARKEMEDADRELAEARAALAEAQASRGASATLAGRTVVRAPFAGVVARRTKNPGDLVEPAATEPVLRLIDPARLEVVASVPLADVSRIEIGAPGRAIVTRNLAPPVRVLSRPAILQPDTSTAPVRLAFTAPSRVAVGTPLRVEIDAEAHEHVVIVPIAAVVHEGEQTFAMVAGVDGKAHRQAVTTGLANGEHVEISSGVKGDSVIVRGQNGLPDGAAITVTR
jgi:RND family efflux transporter MFP subunit